MKNHDECKRGFHWTKKALYADTTDRVNEITFGMYGDGGGTSGEMVMVWEDIGLKTGVPRLCAYDDSWSALSLFGDLIQKLAAHDDKNITQEYFVSLLTSCGFADLTAYTRTD